MIINKIICDRCGKEIKEAHPDRLSIETWTEDTSGRKTVSHYKSCEKIHFCKDCCTEFFGGFMLEVEA